MYIIRILFLGATTSPGEVVVADSGMLYDMVSLLEDSRKVARYTVSHSGGYLKWNNFGFGKCDKWVERLYPQN